jgi:hypothetical protein
MALARIVTQFAGDSEALARDLRARGFDVQITSPDQVPSEPADLEIMLEACASEEALQRAADFHQACVFIAPGSIPTNPPVIQVAPEPALVPDAQLLPEVTLPWAQAEPVSSGEGFEPEPEIAAEIHALASDPEPVKLAEPEPIPETVLPVAQAEIELPAVASNPIEISDEVPASIIAESAAEEGEFTSDWPIWQPVPNEEEIAALQQQPVAYSAATDATSGPPVETVQVVPLMQNAIPAGRGIQNRKIYRRVFQHRIFQNDTLFWKTATVAAIAAVSALVLGASVHRFSPLPPGMAQSAVETQQQVPFGKIKQVVTVQTDTGLLTTKMIGDKSGEALLRPAAAVDPVAATMSEPRTAIPSKKPSVKASRSRRSTDNEEIDTVAEDVVVRHFERPATPPRHADQKPAVKRYSDLD